MIVLKTDVKNLLSKDLSVEQRGLLITAMLSKEKIPAITLAKFKLFVDVKKYREDLIHLHEKGFIKWSGYKYAKKKCSEQKKEPLVHDAIKFMNELYGRNFDYKSNSSNNLRARLKEHSIEKIKLVIANRYEAWKEDDVMKTNLNPVTIFRASLFPKYLEEAERTGKGSGIIKTSKIGLKDGDEITHSLSKELLKDELYSFTTYLTDNKGNAKGHGKLETKTGRDVKILLNVQNNIVKNGGVREFIYIFVKR